ncbi:ankyrin repeat-containing protein [Anaeramoeba flamelloides]|uniref:Ankyrin repeat-containing protein n=1 Tax=Anaeramoeba flamelloides TaxID=1746091 RepID=A0ABQ8XK09_9EUKA|nr:ankyrin repeat-containing protein [Anaeramoeba flamelloides]
MTTEKYSLPNILTHLKSNKLTFVHEWLKVGGDVNSQFGTDEGWNLIHHALYHQCKTKTISTLLEHGAKLDAVTGNGLSLLHFALFKKNETDIIKLLINKGVNMNVLNNKGQTPLMFAVFTRQDPEIIKLLLDAGAEPNVVDDFNFNALTYASHVKATPKVFEYLIRYDTDLSLTSKSKSRTQLHYCCKKKTDPKIIKMLLKSGAKINARTNPKLMTPLMYMVRNARRKDLDSTKVLLDSDCDVFAMNKNGKIAKDFATNTHVIDLLRSHSSLQEDWLTFFERAECTDVEIKKVKFLKFWFEWRTKIKFTNKVKQILAEYYPSEIRTFLKWVYSARKLDTKLIEEICKRLEIKNVKKKTSRKGFRENLIKLYKHYRSRDFKILIPEGSFKKEIGVHKFVLMARSDLYRGMFININSKNLNKVTDYSRRNYATVRALIKFLYTDRICLEQIEQKNLNRLADAVEYYQLNSYSMIKQYLKK